MTRLGLALLALVPVAAIGGDLIGPEGCKTCHQAAWESWRETAHARAHESLPPRNRQDPRLLADIFQRGVLAEDFSLYLHAPWLTDPSLAPAGQAAYYALAPAPNLGKARLDWEPLRRLSGTVSSSTSRGAACRDCGPTS